MGLFSFGNTKQENSPVGTRLQLDVPQVEILDDGQVSGTITVTSDVTANVTSIHLRILQKHVPINPLQQQPPVDGPLERTYAETTLSEAFTLQPGESHQLQFQFSFNPPFGAPIKPAIPVSTVGGGLFGKALNLVQEVGENNPNHQWDFYLTAATVINGAESEPQGNVQLWGKRSVGMTE